MNRMAFDNTIEGNRELDVAMAPLDARARDEVPLIVRYLRILNRRKWLILGSIVVAAILGLLLTLFMTPQYTAQATVEIQRENMRIVQVEGVEPKGGAVDMEFYQTQYSLLRSRALAERVATTLRLYDDRSFFEVFGANNEAEQLAEGQATAGNREARQQRIRRAGEILLDHVSISPVRLSRLVGVEFTSPVPELSSRVANAWVSDFVATTMERKFEATSYARRFLEERLRQVRARLEQSERLLVSYSANQRIINVPTGAPGQDGAAPAERSLVAENLAAFNHELNEATAARVAAESRLRQGGGSTTEALQNQVISGLRERRAELAGEYTRLLSQFEPEYPPARALANQIADIDRSIGREERRVGTTLQEVFRAAAQRESALRARVEGLQGDLLDQRNRAIQYNIYQRDVDTDRELYNGLLQRYREIGVAGGIGVNNISVVDTAQLPQRPSSPNLLLNLFLAMFAGGMVGAGLALALEQMDETIADPSDFESGVLLPLLGTIPRSDNENTIDELEDPKAGLVEAYLSTQARLAFTTDHGMPRSLVVTSSRAGEGKSTTSYALARSLARTGRSVLLVDADMRSPSLHHFFSIGNEAGLSNYLAGERDVDALVKSGFPNGVALLTAGPTPPNAAELLTGDRLSTLIARLKERFDHVIIDAPPVMGLADTPLIATNVEGVIFVVESHRTRVSMARVAVGRLRDAHAHLLGGLLTKFESKRAHYGYGYDYGYGYGQTTERAA